MLPSLEEREALLDALGELIDAHGARDFLSAPILIASHEHFPDEWRADRDGTAAMLRRLLSWARMHDAPFQLDEFDAEEVIEITSEARTRYERPLHGVAAWFSGDERKVLRFGVNVALLGAPEALAGALAHEVAHAWRYRRNEHVQDTPHEEQLTDVTTVFLGFGVLVSNNAERRYSSGSWEGDRFVQRYGTESYGYLSPGALVWLLAAQLVARRDSALGSRVEEALERNQRADLREAMSLLSKDVAALDARLHLPPLGARAEAMPFTHPPVQSLQASAPPIEAGEGPAPTPLLKPGFRVSEPWAGRFFHVMFLVFTGAVAGSIGSIVFSSSYPFWLVVAVPLLRLGYSPYLCSQCEKRVRTSDEQCAECGCRLVGTLERRRDVHEATTDWLRKHGSAEARRALEEDLQLEREALGQDGD